MDKSHASQLNLWGTRTTLGWAIGQVLHESYVKDSYLVDDSLNNNKSPINCLKWVANKRISSCIEHTYYITLTLIDILNIVHQNFRFYQI